MRGVGIVEMESTSGEAPDLKPNALGRRALRRTRKGQLGGRSCAGARKAKRQARPCPVHRMPLGAVSVPEGGRRARSLRTRGAGAWELLRALRWDRGEADAGAGAGQRPLPWGLSVRVLQVSGGQCGASLACAWKERRSLRGDWPPLAHSGPGQAEVLAEELDVLVKAGASGWCLESDPDSVPFLSPLLQIVAQTAGGSSVSPNSR